MAISVSMADQLLQLGTELVGAGHIWVWYNSGSKQPLFFLQKYAHQILATGMHYQQWLDSREKSITLECKNYGRLMCLFYCHSDCPSLNLQYVQERSVGPWLR